jgi:hypothetical protein
MSLWELYHSNRDDIAPLLAPLGSVLVGLGTVLVGGLVARAALRQARTATEQAKTATEVARIANRQAEIAALRHEEQTRADRQRRITDTFSKAVEQLASEKVEVRLGGIYTLERLAGEAPVNRRAAEGPPDPGADAVSELYWTVMETLTAFVRERARWQEPKAASEEEIDAAPRTTPPTDIAAVLEVIRRRLDTGREREKLQLWHFDLTTTDLRGANLRGAHLEGADFREAHLERAYLREAHLEDAILRRAHLERADLSGAHLEGANLSGAHLEGAFLDLAHLEGANLSEATGDAETYLSAGVARPADWPPYKP